MTSLETAVSRSTQLRPRTKELYLQHVRAYLAFIGDTAPSAKNVIAWRDDMRKRRIKPQSVNVALNALRYAAERAEAKFFTDDIERLAVPKQKRESKVDRALSWEEGRKLVKACSGRRGRDLRDNAIITLGLRTGMLRFSMCQLTFKDANLPILQFVKKGGELHTISLDDVTKNALQAWMTWLNEHSIEDGKIFRSLGRQRVDPDDDTAINTQLTPDGLYRALRERARKADLHDLHPHVFRKTFLAWAKAIGAHPGQIAAVTGHKSDAAGDDSGVTTPPANMLLPDWNKKKLS